MLKPCAWKARALIRHILGQIFYYQVYYNIVGELCWGCDILDLHCILWVRISACSFHVLDMIRESSCLSCYPKNATFFNILRLDVRDSYILVSLLNSLLLLA